MESAEENGHADRHKEGADGRDGPATRFLLAYVQIKVYCLSYVGERQRQKEEKRHHNFCSICKFSKAYKNAGLAVGMHFLF